MRSCGRKCFARKATSVILAMFLVLSLVGFSGLPAVYAGTDHAPPIKNIFVYLKNSEGRDVLLKTLTVTDFAALAGEEPHYYSSIDGMPMAVYTEAKGLLLEELAGKLKSLLSAETAAKVDFEEGDSILFKAVDGTSSTRHYATLVGQTGYYYPKLFANFGADSEGVFTVLDKVAAKEGASREKSLLAVDSYQSRKTQNGLPDYIAEHGVPTGAFASRLDRASALRLCLPQTPENIDASQSTTNQLMKWICALHLDRSVDPELSAGEVAAPKYSVSKNAQDATKMDVTLTCGTPGAAIYYAYDDAEYGYVPMPQTLYTAPFTVPVPAEGRTFEFNLYAAKEGSADAGVIRAKIAGNPAGGGASITESGTYHLEDGATGTITIGAGLEVKLIGKGDQAYQDLTIDAAAGVKLTIENLDVKNKKDNIVRFTGAANVLTLAGQNEFLIYDPDSDFAAIRVMDETDLTINGQGLLKVGVYSPQNLGTDQQKGGWGAAIGSNSGNSLVLGNLTIDGGTIVAQSWNGGAAIGTGGRGAGGGGITINGGTVVALQLTGDADGACIGAGQRVAGVPVTINGGTVACYNAGLGAAIGGGGRNGTTGDAIKPSGPVTIHGGTVTAIAKGGGAGIGGGSSGGGDGSGGAVVITGGTVLADGAHEGAADIGAGYNANPTTPGTLKNGEGEAAQNVYPTIIDVKNLAAPYAVRVDGQDFYAGNGHQYSRLFTQYFPTGITPQPSKSETRLYLYLGASENAVTSHTVTVNGTAYPVVIDRLAGESAFQVPPSFRVTANPSSLKAGGTVTADIFLDGMEGKPLYRATANLPLGQAWELAGTDAEAAKGLNGFTVSVAKDAATQKATGIAFAYANPDLNNPGSIAENALPIGQIRLRATTASEQKLALQPYSVERKDGSAMPGVTVTPASVKVLSGGGGGGGGDSTPPAPAPVIPPTPQPASFSDVKAGDWFSDSVKFVHARGLMEGTSATAFSPNRTTSRAMIVTILYRLERKPETVGSTFADVAAGQWFSDAIAWAAKNDIVAGYSDKAFGPNDAVTREQLASILYHYAKHKGYDLSHKQALTGFADSGAVSPWAKTAMEWAVGSRLLYGRSDHALAPTGTATRAEMAALIERFVKQFGK